MCITNSEGKKLFQNCNCHYTSALGICDYCKDPSEFKWCENRILGIIACTPLTIPTLYFGVINLSHYVGALSLLVAVIFGGVATNLTVNYFTGRKGFEVKIFLDDEGHLHCHGVKEKFSGYSTGFEISKQGKTEINSIRTKLWKEAYGFDGQSFLSIHYSETPSKKNLPRIYDEILSPDSKENIYISYHLKIKSVTRNWRLITEDWLGNSCWFYPGELIRLLNCGFCNTDHFNGLVMQSSENVRVNREFAEKLKTAEELIVLAVINQKYVIKRLLEEVKGKRRLPLFVEATAGSISKVSEKILQVANLLPMERKRTDFSGSLSDFSELSDELIRILKGRNIPVFPSNDDEEKAVV